MSTIRVERAESGIARLSLNSGSGNPLTPETLDALAGALDSLLADPPKALVIDGGEGKLFSGGFDVPTIASYGRDELKAFFGNFLASCSKIITFPSPTVCALHSTAIAGGFILSLATDFRVVRTGRLKLGLPEVDLGVPVPAGPQALLAARTSFQHALRLCTTAETIDGEEALRIGLADRLAPNANEAGLALARTLANKPGAGLGRSFVSRPLATRMLAEEARCHELFLDAWFSDAAQARIQAQAARLSGRK